MTQLAARKKRLAQLMRRVRARVVPRTPASTPPEPARAPAAGPGPSAAPAIQLPKTILRTEIETRSRYRLHEFLDHHDASFVRSAYIGILGREPDGVGWDHYLTALRRGSRTKIEILGRIRYSREGRERGVRVSGLLLPFAASCLYRVPVLGYLVRLPVALARLPRNAGNASQLEAYVNSRLAHLESAVDNALTATERVLQHFDHEQSRTRLRSEELHAELSALSQASQAKADAQALRQLLDRVDETEARAVEARAVDVDAHRRLQQEVEALAARSASRGVVEQLSRRLDETAREAVGRDALEQLRSEVSAFAAMAAPRDAVEELAQRLAEAAARAADHGSVDRLREQLAALDAAAARRESVDEISRRLDEAVRRSVDVASHERLIEDLGHARARQDQLREGIDRLEAGRDDLQASERALRADADALRREQVGRFDAQAQRLAELESVSRAQRLAVLEQQRRQDVLVAETRKRLRRKLAEPQLQAILADQSHDRDPIYARIGDHFRGDPEEIVERLREYLPYAAEAVEATRGAPLLDLGCGRGEWLKLASEQGWKVRGVDSNRVMVQRCIDQGLPAEEGDALEYLRAAKSNSFSAITGIHFIEHIPFEDVIALLDESLRTLRSGGIAIFETPNPENLLVGACNFYADPTHRNPIFPLTLEFVVRERGFEKVELLRPWRAGRPEAFEPLPAEDPLAARLNPILAMFDAGFGASPDFAVVGVKA